MADVSGFPGYRVWTNGRVQTRRGKGGRRVWFRDEWRDMAPNLVGPPEGCKYPQVGIRNGSGRRYLKVHRLVLEAFVGPCPRGMEGCHGDGNPLNSNLWNLRWDTRLSNHDDKRKHGRTPAGNKNPKSRIPESEIPVIRRDFSVGFSLKDLAARYGVSRQSIGSIVKRKTWAHTP